MDHTVRTPRLERPETTLNLIRCTTTTHTSCSGSRCMIHRLTRLLVDLGYPDPRWKHPAQCGVFETTNVISFSYEIAEFNEGTTAAYQKRQCNECEWPYSTLVRPSLICSVDMKLSLQGVSLVVSSGDVRTSMRRRASVVPMRAILPILQYSPTRELPKTLADQTSPPTRRVWHRIGDVRARTNNQYSIPTSRPGVRMFRD